MAQRSYTVVRMCARGGYYAERNIIHTGIRLEGHAPRIRVMEGRTRVKFLRAIRRIRAGDKTFGLHRVYQNSLGRIGFLRLRISR